MAKDEKVIQRFKNAGQRTFILKADEVERGGKKSAQEGHVDFLPGRTIEVSNERLIKLLSSYAEIEDPDAPIEEEEEVVDDNDNAPEGGKSKLAKGKKGK